MANAGVRKIPLKYFKEFEEARFVFKPYPGLMILDAAMLARVKALMADKNFREQFDIAIVPKMM